MKTKTIRSKKGTQTIDVYVNSAGASIAVREGGKLATTVSVFEECLPELAAALMAVALTRKSKEPPE